MPPHSARPFASFKPDLYTQSASLQSNPVAYALSNVTAAAQGVSGIDPDTYLYWDDVHPTTTGHHFITAAAENLLAPLAVPTVTLTASPADCCGESKHEP